MKKEICIECDGNGYVRVEGDPETGQIAYRDCDRCDSQGEITVAEADPAN